MPALTLRSLSFAATRLVVGVLLLGACEEAPRGDAPAGLRNSPERGRLRTDPTAVLVGPAPDTFFGQAISRGGDVNGDGFGEVIVGAIADQSFRGRVYLFSGSEGGLLPLASWEAGGEGEFHQFGAAIAGGGDLNGDGFADLVVGAPGYAWDQGRVYVYLGSSSGFPESPSQVIAGSATSRFGQAVEFIGDTNGDGLDDLAIGLEPFSDASVEVHYGSAEGLSGSTALGGTDGPACGRHLAALGDLNHDGYADLAVGCAGVDEYRGEVQVYLGSSSGMTDTPRQRLLGWATEETFGTALAGLGDINGDGWADLAVGAPGHASLLGRVDVFFGGSSGFADRADQSTAGEVVGDQYGMALAAPGDMDGDGFAELGVGAPDHSGASGRLYIYRGSPSGRGDTPEGLFTGAEPGDYFAAALDSAGDLDGDGLGELLVAAVGASGNYGEVRVYGGEAETPEDADGDGSPAGEDCDDSEPSIHPGASETAGDGVDQDCDGVDTASGGDSAENPNTQDSGTREEDAEADLGEPAEVADQSNEASGAKGTAGCATPVGQFGGLGLQTRWGGLVGMMFAALLPWLRRSR